MSNIPAPAPEWYVRQAFLRTMRGEQFWPTKEPDNKIVSLAAARTLKAVEILRRARATPERPL
jgi:hypothetical protein